MDIAKYLGLFLLENEHCYLHGIGNLEVMKLPATYDKDSGKLNPSIYKIVFSKTSGSIDDAFANYIANNERVSISHAANHLKTFFEQTRTELKEGGEVDIPGIGKFFTDANGEIDFAVNPNLEIKGKQIPFFKISESAEKRQGASIKNVFENTEIKEPKADEDIVIKPPQVNWAKILTLALVIVLILGAALYFILNSNAHSEDTTPTEHVGLQSSDIKEFEPESIPETEELESGSNTASNSFKVLVNDYPTEERAETRKNQLNSFGHETSVRALENGRFGVILNLPEIDRDEAFILDSLKRFFGREVEIVD